MKNWKDIQEGISKAEEPLSPGAWSGLEAQLDRPSRARMAWLVAFALLVLSLSGWMLGEILLFQKEYYQPRVATTAPSGEQTHAKEAPSDYSPLKNKETTTAETGQAERRENTEAPVADTVGNGEREAQPESSEKRYRKEESAFTVENTEEGYETKRSYSGGNGHRREEKLSLNIKGIAQPGFIGKLLPVSLAAPDSLNAVIPTDGQNPSRFELRFFMAGTYNLPGVEYKSTEAQTHKHFETALKDAVKPGWGVDAGFEVRYRLFQNFRISTGFSYREIVTQNNFDFEVSEIPVIDSATGNILAYLPTSQPQRRVESGSNIYTFLNVPLSLYYEQPLGGRFTLTGEALNHISFLLNHSGQQIDPTTLELRKSNDDVFNKVINSYQLRLGLRYRVTDNFYLAVEPAYRKSYQDFIRDESVSWKPEDLSLSLTGIVILK